jgi:hypothetical protein
MCHLGQYAADMPMLKHLFTAPACRWHVQPCISQAAPLRAGLSALSSTCVMLPAGKLPAIIKTKCRLKVATWRQGGST